MKYKQIINKINNLLNKNKINKEENLINKPEINKQKIEYNKFGYPVYVDKNQRNLKQ